MDDKLKSKIEDLADNANLIKTRVILLLDKYKKVKSEIDELEEWNSLEEIVKNIGSITDVVISTVFLVEVAANDVIDNVTGLTSEDKLDAAVALIDKFIKGPWYVELADGILIRFALQFGISLVVSTINKYIGNKWNLDKIRDTFETVNNVREVIANTTDYGKENYDSINNN